MEWVSSASLWHPDALEYHEYVADGIEPCSQLEVSVYRAHRNPTDIKIDIMGLGLRCVGEGSGESGPCFSFALA